MMAHWFGKRKGWQGCCGPSRSCDLLVLLHHESGLFAFKKEIRSDLFELCCRRSIFQAFGSGQGQDGQTTETAQSTERGAEDTHISCHEDARSFTFIPIVSIRIPAVQQINEGCGISEHVYRFVSSL
jgi:hypothetical protein